MDLGAAGAAGRVVAEGHASSVANRTACRVNQARTRPSRISHALAAIDARTHDGLSLSGPGHDVHAALLQGRQLHCDRTIRHGLGAPSVLSKKQKMHRYANKCRNTPPIQFHTSPWLPIHMTNTVVGQKTRKNDQRRPTHQSMCVPQRKQWRCQHCVRARESK